jgi:hypothetical protein
MFYVKTKGKMQDIQDKETNTDELQGRRELKKSPAGGMGICVLCVLYSKDKKRQNAGKSRRRNKNG